MVLVAEERKLKDEYHGPFELAIPLLALAGISRNFVTVMGAELDGDKVSMKLRYNVTSLNIPTRLAAESGLLVAYEQTGENEGEIRFSKSRKVERCDFLLECDGFHKTLDAVFGTRSRSPVFEDLKPKTLEGGGLDVPSSLEAHLVYETPMAVWRGLPEELRRRISRFEFAGPFRTISWPRIKDHHKDGTRLETSISYGRGQHSEADNEALATALMETGFVERRTTESKSIAYPHKRDEFIVDPKNMTLRNIERLEEITRHLIEGGKVARDATSTITISGEVGRDDFYLIPELFDNFASGYFGSSSVGSGNIEVYTKHRLDEIGSIRGGTIVRYNGATLEQVERLLSTGIESKGIYVIQKVDGKDQKPFALKRREEKKN